MAVVLDRATRTWVRARRRGSTSEAQTQTAVRAAESAESVRSLQRNGRCGKLACMGNAALDVSKLSREEQTDLVDELWRALGRDPEALPLSDEQRADLDRRLDELEVEGAVGMTWDEVVAEARAARH